MEPCSKNSASAVLKDQTNSNCELAEKKKLSKTKRRKLKSEKKQTKSKESEEIDLDALIEDNRQNELSQKLKKEKRKVENCPHIIKQDYKFMCSTCRMMCCEPCLVDNHKGHRWCELMPYIPSEDEPSATEDSEVPVQINTRGKRRLPGGFISTRRPGTHREREKDKASCGCSGCRHDPKSLKRLVPIDESRFSTKEIENGTCDENSDKNNVSKSDNISDKQCENFVKENSSFDDSKETQTVAKKKRKKKKRVGKESSADVSDTNSSVTQETDTVEDIIEQEKVNCTDRENEKTLSGEINHPVKEEKGIKENATVSENMTLDRKSDDEKGEKGVDNSKTEYKNAFPTAIGKCLDDIKTSALLDNILKHSSVECPISKDSVIVENNSDTDVKTEIKATVLSNSSDSNVDVPTNKLLDEQHDEEFRREVDAKIKKYDDGSGEFAKAVREWLAIPKHLRITSVQEAWSKMGKVHPKTILHRLAPTERERYVKQCTRLVEKQELNLDHKIPDMVSGLDAFKKLHFKNGVPNSDSEKEIENRCNLVVSGINQIKKRYISIFEKPFREMGRYHILIDAMALPQEEEKFYLSQMSKPLVEQKVSPNKNGLIPFGETNEAIELAIKFLKLNRTEILNPDLAILEKFLLTKLDQSMLQEIIGTKGIAVESFSNPQAADPGFFINPLDCMKEVDQEEMEQDELSREIMVREQLRLERHAMKNDIDAGAILSFVSSDHDNAEEQDENPGAQFVITDISELMEMLEEGSRIFPYIGKKRKEPTEKRMPADIYSICTLSADLAWMHKIGHDSNVLVTRQGKVIKEVEFGTSTESLTVTGKSELLASDPLKNRILKVVSSERITEYLKFDDLMPLGICWSHDNNLLVCLTEVYYEYDVAVKHRRLVARVDPTGKFLQEIEFTQTRDERYFIIPARVRESKNGDICVVDRIQKNRGRLLIFNKDGKLLEKFEGNSKLFDRPFDPRDIDFDYKHRLLTCDYSNNSIIIFQPTYDLFKVVCAFEGGLRYPLCMCIDSNCSIWAGCKYEKVMILSYDAEFEEDPINAVKQRENLSLFSCF